MAVNPDVYRTALRGLSEPALLVIAAVLGRIGAEASRHLGGAVEEVRVTHPARWGERRRAVLVEPSRMLLLDASRERLAQLRGKRARLLVASRVVRTDD